MYVKLTKPKKSKNLNFEYLTVQGKQKITHRLWNSVK